MNLGGVGKVEGTASTISVNSHFPHVKCYKSIVMATCDLGDCSRSPSCSQV